ncbi:MAG: glycosyltransferase family 4 protein [Oligoflexia bacterium]|nr:glycosyltransferase family 4 protein [Oligoflexia bacterium]
MKVAFDLSTAAFEKKTGTGVYCDELVRAYQTEFENRDEIYHSYRLSRWLKGSKYFLNPPKHGGRLVDLGLLTPWRGLKLDVFHGLNNRLPVLSHCKKIATVHDLFSIRGGYANASFNADQAQKLKKMISDAHHIIVPATITKELLIKEFGINSEAITVIAHGVRQEFLQPIERKVCQQWVKSHLGIHNKFVLHVGTLEARKNILGVIETFNHLGQKHPETDLVLAGHPGFGFEQIRSKIEESPRKSKIRILGFQETEALRNLFVAAEGLLFLSWEEGFGIPIIEALACGLPVVSSNTSCMPEVGQGCTELVNPSNPKEASAKMALIIENREKMTDRIQEVKRRFSAQTWGKTARQTRDVYLKVLQSDS